jgi:hypothetical protein
MQTPTSLSLVNLTKVMPHQVKHRGRQVFCNAAALPLIIQILLLLPGISQAHQID